MHHVLLATHKYEAVAPVRNKSLMMQVTTALIVIPRTFQVFSVWGWKESREVRWQSILALLFEYL